jgi:chromosome segregation ATPase
VNLFKKSPEKKLQADLDAARTDCVTLAARVTAAEQAVLERQAEARKLARDNADEATLDTANANVRKAQDRLATLAAALDEAKAAVADLERQVTEQTDRKVRAESAAKAMQLADECEAAPDNFDATVNDILDVASRAALIIHDARGVEIFLSSARMEIRIALESVANPLRSHASQILSGAVPAGLPKPAAPPAPTVTPPGDDQNLFDQTALLAG